MERDASHRITELLCSHLCHEVISPVTAINNGLELIGSGDPALEPEAIELTRHSAAEASRRLQFYRLAYGLAAGFDAARGLVEAQELSKGLLAGGKIKLAWSDGGVTGSQIGKPGVKLLLNVVALAREALPRGGTVSVTLAGPPDFVCTVTAEGAGARLTPEIRSSMEDNAAVDDLTPRTIHAYLVATAARRLDTGFAVDSGHADRVVFRLRLPTPNG